jgi:hypothetical protein
MFSTDALGTALRELATPIFAATRSDGALFVHVAAVVGRREAAAGIRRALEGERNLTIRFHNERDLLTPRSLERLVRRFTGDEVVYDPTESVTRAKALVAAAHASRAALGAKIGGLFYAPRLRTLFVALDAKQIAVGEKIKVGALAEIERQIAAALRGAFAGRISDCPAVRVGFGVPAIELVPVDQRSVTGWSRRALGLVRRYWKPVAIATLFGFGANAAAAKDPAVSQTNIKITGLRGAVDEEDSWFANATLTTPLGQSWGLQVEGGVNDVDGNTTWGAAAHVFTRDPESYLLGLFAAYASEDQFDIDATRVGAEAELYLNQVSILAAAGYQFSDGAGDTAFGDIEVRWYITNDFALSGGGSFDETNSIGRVGVEWQPGFSALPGLAFRIDGAFGEDDYQSIMGGITYYFGADASLKDRHRRQDPASALNSLLLSVQKEQKQLCTQYGNC